MEQIAHPKDIIRQAREHLSPSDVTPIHDPLPVWARLTRVEFDPVSLDRHNVVTETPNITAAPFDHLRTRIMRQMSQKGHRRLAMTAATSGCGTSTIVANLALSFARQADFKVLVFDLDLRAPSLLHIFGLEERGPRFSALTGHRRNFASTCLRFGETLGLSLNASSVDYAAEHLFSSKTQELFDYVETEFAPDLMLFDLPALGPRDDALAALGLADCALLIAHADRSTVQDVDWAERQIAETCDPLGVVLNKCRFAEAPGLSRND